MTTWRAACAAVFVLFYDVSVIGHVFFYVMCKGREMRRARTHCLHTRTVPDWAKTVPSLNASI